MKQKIIRYLLGFYNLVLTAGAIVAGVMMIKSNYGIFEAYPQEWTSKTPFESWFMIGILVIMIFGVGNTVAAILSLKNAYVFSIIMGGVFLLSVVAQIIILGEWYLATIEFLALSLTQLSLSTIAVYSSKSNDDRIPSQPRKQSK